MSVLAAKSVIFFCFFFFLKFCIPGLIQINPHQYLFFSIFPKFCIPGLTQINPHQFCFIPSLTHHLSNKESSCELPTIWVASIVSRFGYTMAIWACVCPLSKPKETKRNNKTKGLATNPETRQVAIFFIGFGLIQINPERSGNVKLSYSRKNTIGFHASTVYTAGFFRQTNAFFKKMACCIHRGWSAVFQEAFFFTG